MENKGELRPLWSITEAEKHQMINEYLRTRCTKQSIWYKYTGRQEDHGRLLRWMQSLGYTDPYSRERYRFTEQVRDMSLPNPEKLPKEQSYEEAQLQQRILHLEKQLKEAELKAIAYSTMIDIAEQELKIVIRKKSNTKP